MSDLISRSALIEALGNYCPDYKSSTVGCIVNSTVNECIKIVNEQPTIEAVPVVHGKWVKYSFSCVCTQCEKEFEDDDIRRIMGEGKMPNFCPECGADMRKGDGYETD